MRRRPFFLLPRANRAEKAFAHVEQPNSRIRPLPKELTGDGSRRPVELPAGWSREKLIEMLSTVSIESAPRGEMDAYLQEDFERFLISWEMTRPLAGRALEIGANPYFTTVLLREFTALDLTLTNSFDPTLQSVEVQRVQYCGADGHDVEHDFQYHSLNVETMTFPFSDGCYQVVLFCEVIEHLLVDPVHALGEIHRVLEPGGTLLISTPNVARLENVARVVTGANVYDPYSGYGPYGRHNREYTRHELVRLLSFCGFEVCHHFTADVHPHNTASYIDAGVLEPALSNRLPDLGQYLFAVARKAGPVCSGRPSWLYRSMPAGELRDE